MTAQQIIQADTLGADVDRSASAGSAWNWALTTDEGWPHATKQSRGNSDRIFNISRAQRRHSSLPARTPHRSHSSNTSHHKLIRKKKRAPGVAPVCLFLHGAGTTSDWKGVSINADPDQHFFNEEDDNGDTIDKLLEGTVCDPKGETEEDESKPVLIFLHTESNTFTYYDKTAGAYAQVLHDTLKFAKSVVDATKDEDAKIAPYSERIKVALPAESAKACSAVVDEWELEGKACVDIDTSEALSAEKPETPLTLETLVIITHSYSNNALLNLIREERVKLTNSVLWLMIGGILSGSGFPNVAELACLDVLPANLTAQDAQAERLQTKDKTIAVIKQERAKRIAQLLSRGITIEDVDSSEVTSCDQEFDDSPTEEKLTVPKIDETDKETDPLQGDDVDSLDDDGCFFLEHELHESIKGDVLDVESLDFTDVFASGDDGDAVMERFKKELSSETVSVDLESGAELEESLDVSGLHHKSLPIQILGAPESKLKRWFKDKTERFVVSMSMFGEKIVKTSDKFMDKLEDWGDSIKGNIEEFGEKVQSNVEKIHEMAVLPLQIVKNTSEITGLTASAIRDELSITTKTFAKNTWAAVVSKLAAVVGKHGQYCKDDLTVIDPYDSIKLQMKDEAKADWVAMTDGDPDTESAVNFNYDGEKFFKNEMVEMPGQDSTLCETLKKVDMGEDTADVRSMCSTGTERAGNNLKSLTSSVMMFLAGWAAKFSKVNKGVYKDVKLLDPTSWDAMEDPLEKLRKAHDGITPYMSCSCNRQFAVDPAEEDYAVSVNHFDMKGQHGDRSKKVNRRRPRAWIQHQLTSWADNYGYPAKVPGGS